MEQTVKERLVAYLKYKKIGWNKFEAEAGLSRGYIGHLKDCPSPAKQKIIFAATPDLNRLWLLTGEGPMLKNDESDNEFAQQIRTLTETIHLLTETLKNKDDIIVRLRARIKELEQKKGK